MSKNTNLSFLTDFLTADIVNSRVGMNNASPQSTFDVTGTGKFSGILTLGSTVSNGTYTYTLPSATGTLALVGGSGVGTVTSVAAITLGTSGTDLTSTVANGTTTPVITLNVPDASVTARGVITTGTQYIAGLKIFTSTIVANVDLQLPAAGTASTTFIKNISGSGLTSIGSNGFGFNNSDNIYFSGSNKAGGVFAFNNTGNRTYTLPDASGTLAFTSDLSGYLPLTGGTLTGALNGTSATFSGNLNLQAGVTRNINFYDSSNTNINAQIQYDQITSNSGQLLFGTNNAGTFSTKLTIANTGAATFSSTVQATQFYWGGTVNNNLSAGSISIVDSGTGTKYLQLSVSNTVANIATNYTNSNIPLTLNSYGNTNQLYLSTSGNVLIGTATDSSGKLQVLGADNTIISQIKSTTGMIQIYPYLTAADGPLIQALDGGGANFKNLRIECIATTIKGPNSIVTDGSAANINLHTTTAFGANIGGTIGFGGLFNGSAITEFAVIAGKKENATINNLSGYLAFYTRGALTDPIERMRINSSGNVGIGTDSIAASSGYKMLRINGATTGGEIVLAGAEVEYGYMYANAGNFVIDALASQPMRFRTGAQNRMEISSDGAITMSVPTSGQTLTISGKNNNWTQEIVGSSTTGQSYGLLITAGTNSSDYPIYAQNQAGNTVLFRVRGDGVINTGTASGSPYNNTSGSAANMVVSSGGTLERSTSSLKYKTNIVNYDKGLAEVLKMRPVYYKSINEREKDLKFAGLIAEEIEELGLTEFVQYAEDGTPDAISYSNMVSLLVKAIQELKAELDELKSKN